MGLKQIWWRFLRPSRTIRPTREGWWFLLAILGLGLVAFNTGNNLLYLLVSTLLGLIVVSGILSEQSMRGLRLTRLLPGEIFAGQPVRLGLVATNTKRRLHTYSLILDSIQAAGPRLRVFYLQRLEPGQEVLVTFEEKFPRRGRHRLHGVRVTTRFPFGFFLKANRPLPGQEVLVYPAVRELAPGEVPGLAGVGTEPERQVGHGSEFHSLREYRWGDDPRLIHWKSSAKTDTMLIRELEAETALAVCLILEPAPGPSDSEKLEAALSWAASLAAHLIAAGARVELAGPGLHVPLGRGRAHLRRILEALALFDLNEAPAGSPPPATPRPLGGSRLPRPSEPSLRVIRIPLGGSAAR